MRGDRRGVYAPAVLVLVAVLVSLVIAAAVVVVAVHFIVKYW